MTDVLVDLLALLLDLSNIIGGLLLASVLLNGSRAGAGAGAGAGVARVLGGAVRVAPVVGIVALATGGYFLIVHLTSGPHVFHFELVGIGVGVALLWDRLTGRSPLWGAPAGPGGAPGPGLLLGVFGIIAVVVGLQGLLTSNG